MAAGRRFTEARFAADALYTRLPEVSGVPTAEREPGLGKLSRRGTMGLLERFRRIRRAGLRNSQ